MTISRIIVISGVFRCHCHGVGINSLKKDYLTFPRSVYTKAEKCGRYNSSITRMGVGVGVGYINLVWVVFLVKDLVWFK